jgi:hypothetical protein
MKHLLRLAPAADFVAAAFAVPEGAPLRHSHTLTPESAQQR